MGKAIKRNAVQTAILMMILTLASKTIGFVRELVMANFFGTSYVVDVYVMAYSITSVLFGGLIAAISTAYMPIFSRISEESGEEEGNRFTNQIINLLFIITIIIALTGLLFSDQVIKIFANNFDGERAALGSFYIKILFSYIIFSSTSMILEAYLQYKGTFLPQIISGYFVSISMIIGIIVSAYMNYYYLAFGTLIGYMLRGIAIARIAKKRGYKYRKDFKVGNNVKDIVRLSLPVFVGSYMTYINLFIDKSLASGLREGSIAALNYSSILNTMIIGITISILSTIIYPKLTQANSLEQYDRFNELVKSAINIILIIGIPCSLGAMLYSNQIVQIVYERGAFNTAATSMTGSAFMFYASGMLFMAINDFIIRVYYSMRDMKTPMIFGAISVIINIVLNLILVQTMQHNGLALATSVSAMCNMVLLCIGIKKKYFFIEMIESKNKVIKILIASVCSIGASYIIYILILEKLNEFFFMRMAQLGIAVIVAGIIYLCMLQFFKIEELKLIKQIFIRRKSDGIETTK